MKKTFLSILERAHFEKNIKLLLQPYFEFRLYITFRLDDGRAGKKRHFYGNEHSCTYQQVLFGKVPFIAMDKHKGFMELVGLVEGPYRGQYIGAKIFGREPGKDTFDILHRDYLRGEIKMRNDPKFPIDDQKYNLKYTIENNKIVILSKEA
jgi:hypothetical protein